MNATVTDLRKNVLEFGTTVSEQLRTALTAVDTLDLGLAKTVIHVDEEINDRYLELESDCIDLLALDQPVAGKLRVVVASFKILTDLERIGDLATNLAGVARTLVEDVTNDTFAGIPLVEIGEFAFEMVDDALHAFETTDLALCQELVVRDDDLNDRCIEATRSIIHTLVSNAPVASFPDAVTPAAVRDVLVLVRDIERVGDHAVNIAARTYYMAEFDDALLY